MPCLERRKARDNSGRILEGEESAVEVFLLRARASVPLRTWPGLVQE